MRNLFLFILFITSFSFVSCYKKKQQPQNIKQERVSADFFAMHLPQKVIKDCVWGGEEDKTAVLCFVGYDFINRFSYQKLIALASTPSSEVLSPHFIALQAEVTFPDGEKTMYGLPVSYVEKRVGDDLTMNHYSEFFVDTELAQLDWDRWSGEIKNTEKICQIRGMALHYDSPFSGNSYDGGKTPSLGFIQSKVFVQRHTHDHLFEDIKKNGIKYCQNSCYIAESKQVHCESTFDEKKVSCENQTLNLKPFLDVSSKCEKFVIILEKNKTIPTSKTK